MSSIDATVAAFRREWQDVDGFLNGVRARRISPEAASRFASLIRNLTISKEGTSIDRRLVAELWDIPYFLYINSMSMKSEADRQLVEEIANESWSILVECFG
jgi:hypothetical protein